MFLTRVLLKKAKSKHVLVQLQSRVSGHTYTFPKLRGSDKVELIAYDPFIRQDSVYFEKKKVKGFKL